MLLAKTNIEAAFQVIPVHPDSFQLLRCLWLGQYFVDRCLPMGCAISCFLFETFSPFLEWVVQTEACIPSVLHCLDYFLFVGPPRVCRILLHTMETVDFTFVVQFL